MRTPRYSDKHIKTEQERRLLVDDLEQRIEVLEHNQAQLISILEHYGLTEVLEPETIQ